MYKKDEFSPATSERDVDVQDKVDEADVAKDDCPREPKKWGAYATQAGSMEKESLKHGVQPSEASEKNKARSTMYARSILS